MRSVNKNITQSKSIGRYVRTSSRKVNRVLKQIRGRPYKEALLLLEYMPYKSCGLIWKILYSALSNAEHNFSITKENLIISEAFVSQGPGLKRFRPRAKGQIFKIKKPSCHIYITLQEKKY